MMCLLMSLFLFFFSIACITLSYEELWTTAVRGKSEPPIALIHYWKCVLPARWVNTSAQRCSGSLLTRDFYAHRKINRYFLRLEVFRYSQPSVEEQGSDNSLVNKLPVGW